MMTVGEKIKTALAKKRDGSVVSACMFSGAGSRAAVDKALARMSRTGELMRIARGAYVLPVKGKFGSYPPPAEKVIRSYAKVKQTRIVQNGALAANRFGLTTQQPIREIYLTSGRAEKLALGGNPVELKHVPKWQTVLPNEPAGEAVRAIAYVGKNNALQAAIRIRKELRESEWLKLTNIKQKLPAWVSEAISEAERAG